MEIRFAIDKAGKLITCSVDGALNRNVLISLLTQLRVLSANNPGCNLLFDLSRTSLDREQMDMHRVIDVVSGILDLQEQLGDRIAHVVPDLPERVGHAEDIGSVAVIRGLNYRVFADLDQARLWLLE